MAAVGFLRHTTIPTNPCGSKGSHQLQQHRGAAAHAESEPASGESNTKPQLCGFPLLPSQHVRSSTAVTDVYVSVTEQFLQPLSHLIQGHARSLFMHGTELGPELGDLMVA